VLQQHDGVVRTSALLAAGVTGKQIGALTGRGVLERPRNAWYVDPALGWEAKCAVRVGGILTCVSAVDSFGLPVPNPPVRRIHVRVPANSARQRHHRNKRHYVVPGEDREVVLHWTDGPGARTGWRVGLVDALLELAGCVPEDWWIAALDAARHRPRDGEPLLSDDDWARFRDLVPRRLHRALELVDPRSESVLETLVRLGLLRRGIPVVDLQFAPDPAHRVDFLLPGKLVVEADGEAWHDPEADRIRDAFLRGLGYRVLRFSSRRILHDLDGVLDEIEAALTA
jgi:very-short-patch-repair endonuclease